MVKAISKKTIHIYELLAGLFVMTLIVSNIASVKMVSVGPFVFDAGTILFPLAYIIGDIVTEIYGFKMMRRLLYVGIITLLVTSLTFWVVGALPAATDWANQAAYDSILGVVWRIVGASITAIFVGELLNAYVLSTLKIKTKGKNLWGRIVGSSAIGGLVDTIVFSVLAFAGTMPADVMVQLIATVYFIKLATEVIVSPLTVKIITLIKRSENVDVYEAPSLSLNR
jgi:uncharacterized integral membrane protein (TIGR00697 family)